MSDDKPFIHLHVHTEYSLLDGLSRISKLVSRAQDLNMHSLAITDHGAMFGVIDFYRACKKVGIKPIVGMEAYLARRSMQDRDPKLDTRPFHLLLLAKNETGYKNLLKIASAAQLEGYYYRPRIDRDFLARHAEGLVATSGCLAAQIPSMIMDGRDNDAKEQIGWYQDVFGAENFFLELQQHDIPELKTLNKWLFDYAQSGHSKVELVATNDVHYVRKEDYDAHDTLLCIQTSTLKSDSSRLRMSDPSYHLTDQEEMWGYFHEVPEALYNTVKIAEMCELDLDRKGYHLPNFPVPGDHTADTYLRYLAEKGLHWRYGSHADDANLRERLEYELNVIHTMGFDTYFLIVWDLCEYARHADIWWNVRGSGAGSVTAYCLGITNIDPIQNNLLFERFLNPGRVSMPDIDIDYPDDRRGEMIAYTARKYGEDQVAAIITFGTLGAKAAVRDVGRALGVPLELVNQAARLIPTEPKPKPVKEYVELNPELQQLYKADEDIRLVIDTAEHLQGVSRHVSTHAAGIIVGDKPLVEYIPLHRQTKGENDEENPLKLVTQFPMETCESIGLLKVDFLGLSTLTILRRACDLIERHQGIQYNMSNIPYRPSDNDEHNQMLEETFELIGRGDTVGVFQVESTGMQQTLRGMRPKKFEHIVAAISLYRPGPMDYIPTYNNRMHGVEPVIYHHPKLESILGETFGICVSGDTLVFNAKTGERHAVRDLQHSTGGFSIQGVGDNYEMCVAPVSDWIFNGHKEVYRVKLRNGAEIKTTIDHRFLTEDGWKPLSELSVGEHVATPPYLVEPTTQLSVPREHLRILAYLIGDGSLASGSSVDFVSKDQRLIDEYVRCLNVFGNLRVTYITQIHDVTRVSANNGNGKGTSPLLRWMRELGLKHERGMIPAGCRSQEKFIPDFVFRLSNNDIAYFLASIWDCDGYMGKKLCHYKTISQRLAWDIQTLLLRLGIGSTIHESSYESSRGKRDAFQVTVYDTAKLAEALQPHMLTEKADVECHSIAMPTIQRARFVRELDSVVSLSRRELMAQYGFDRQHFAKKDRERISSPVVRELAETLHLDRTLALINILWEPIKAIEYVGVEDVYDLTVEGIHNFVANDIIVHNCVYQEQLMQIASNLFGYSLGDADLMRRAVSKKKKEDLLKHKDTFLKRGPELDETMTPEIAEKIFDEIEFFANYGFNKCLVASTEIIDAETGSIVTIGDVAAGKAALSKTITCDTDTLRLANGRVSAAMSNGVKPVYRLTTRTGRTITATDNHPFYSFEGWRNLSDLQAGDLIATPRRLPVEGKNTWPAHQITALAQRIVAGLRQGSFEATSEAYQGLRTADTSFELSEPTLLPVEIFGLSNHNLAQLLAFVWETAGVIEADSLLLFTDSERLARQFQHILLRFGVVAIYENGILKLNQSEAARFVAEVGHYFLGQAIISAFSSAVETGLEDIYWDEIVSIEYAGEEETFDLTIEGTHNFIANDILVHNSHAADYGVITVQTAFLKTHYPEEYMTALLSVYFDDATKVTTFLAECKRLNIPILPPDVNYSMLDFDIQKQADSRRGIRFGMAAVKNAGVGALQHIITAREGGGIFRDLLDFCTRIDLRAVGKRTVESLIKVGALTAFGTRPQLLSALDRMMSFSAEHHKAKDIGQISLFGGDTGIVEDDLLKNLPPHEEATQREMLNWERELLGLYVTSHPIDPVLDMLKFIEVDYSYKLKEATPEEQDKGIKLVALVAGLRKIPTKNHEMMAVAQLEDRYGTIDAVLFPRTWRQYESLVEEGKVLLFMGKLDVSRGDPQMICESVSSNFDAITSADMFVPPSGRDAMPVWMEDTPTAQPEPAAPPAAQHNGANGHSNGYSNGRGNGHSNGNGNGSSNHDMYPPDLPLPEEAPPWVLASEPLYDMPLDGNEDAPPAPPQRITVYFERSGDNERDMRRLRKIHSILSSYPGKDRFAIVSGGYEFDFPNDTTQICDPLIAELKKIENTSVIVKPIP